MQIVGGIGSGVSYDWPFRAFAQADSYQMLFDLDAMQKLYGVANPFGQNAAFTGIGMFDSKVRIAMNGLGNNDVVFDALTQPPSISAASPVAAAVPLGRPGSFHLSSFDLILLRASPTASTFQEGWSRRLRFP